MKRKSKSKNTPWEPAQPFILQGLQNSGRVFDETQPQLEQFAGMQRDTYARLAPGAEQGILNTQAAANAWSSGARSGQNPGAATYGRVQGFTNAAIPGATTMSQGGFVGQGEGADYWRRSLNGDFLNGNPHLDAVIANGTEDALNAVNSNFSLAGRYGSGAHTGVAAREAGKIASNLRYNDYATERGYQNQAAGLLDGATRADRGQQLQALGLLGEMSGADANRQLQTAGMADNAYNADMAREMAAWGTSQDLMRGSQGLLSEAANLPWLGVAALNGNVRQASNGYGTTKTTSSGSILDGIQQVGNIFSTFRGY